ncbi:hypothetical protein [Dyella psychrodurans]|uniref:Lipoprotein n=1 Tax=Dyella psychrodurans TaxID=1927960 RepID=A0A370WW69_9GAMM|nr:hypothetical protein [Dyella psychrodurans]RDS80306.1 hypothetical protein DWU99_19450 [Dyella psychrodurans]
MELANKAALFRQAPTTRLGCLALGLLLAGCGHATRKVTLPPPPPPKPVAATGISPCDAYLDSYLACHRAAEIYTPDTLQAHYQAIRTGLLQDANDPRTRPYLANRCMGLQAQLSAALKGRSCNTQTASGNAKSANKP